MSQKVLVFDIETRPMLAWVWGLKDQNIALNQIHQDWGVIAWAAKWLEEKRVTYMDLRKSPNVSDKALLRPLWKLLDEADIVVTQNGKKFDSRKLNARFIEHGMQPPSPYKHLDTYMIAKNAAEFSSHKLEYLTDKLCTKYKKLTHKNFPGFTLWSECMKGNQAAWKEMEIYNRHDVLATEELYMKLRGWLPANAPRIHPENKPDKRCEGCDSDRMQKHGPFAKRSGLYQRYRCMSCGLTVVGEKL